MSTVLVDQLSELRSKPAVRYQTLMTDLLFKKYLGLYLLNQCLNILYIPLIIHDMN